VRRTQSSHHGHARYRTGTELEAGESAGRGVTWGSSPPSLTRRCRSKGRARGRWVGTMLLQARRWWCTAGMTHTQRHRCRCRCRRGKGWPGSWMTPRDKRIQPDKARCTRRCSKLGCCRRYPPGRTCTILRQLGSTDPRHTVSQWRSWTPPGTRSPRYSCQSTSCW
jgi:hypothetical protein